MVRQRVGDAGVLKSSSRVSVAADLYLAEVQDLVVRDVLSPGTYLPGSLVCHSDVKCSRGVRRRSRRSALLDALPGRADTRAMTAGATILQTLRVH